MKLTQEQQVIIKQNPDLSSRQLAVLLFGKVKRKSTINDYRKQLSMRAVDIERYTTKVLFLDIETSLQVATCFGRFDINLSETDVLEHSLLLCAVGKWLNGDVIEVKPDDYTKWNDPLQQRKMLNKLWMMVDAADIVVCHNVAFDVKKLNAFFLLNGMKPPSTFKTFCTLRAARTKFSLFSNKLGDLAAMLELEYRKVDVGGKAIWRGCHRGEAEAFDHMVYYCRYDVIVLEELFFKLLPWVKIPMMLVDGKPVTPSLVSTGKLFTTPTQAYELFEAPNGKCYRSKTGLLERQDVVAV